MTVARGTVVGCTALLPTRFVQQQVVYERNGEMEGMRGIRVEAKPIKRPVGTNDALCGGTSRNEASSVAGRSNTAEAQELGSERVSVP